MKTPYNYFFLAWSIIGIIIFGIGFVKDFIISKNFEIDKNTYMQILWFFVFVLYIYNYFKNLIDKKK
tara:strand:+ start:1287 stop:1487 length:201 start_codon:yes stop_codon:yes gene_type:complete